MALDEQPAPPPAPPPAGRMGLQRLLLRALFEHGVGRLRSLRSAAPASRARPRPELREATAEEMASGATCRFCLEAGCEGEEKLVAPCSCQGTMLWVHVACLRRWQRASMAALTGHESVCSVCHTSYALPPIQLPPSPVRAGVLLVASEELGGTFSHSVILLCEVNARGAHGVIINNHFRNPLVLGP